MTTMPFEDLEQVYEDLAQAVDRAGRANESLFLAKLALALVHRAGSLAIVRACIDEAMRDLPASGRTTS